MLKGTIIKIILVVLLAFILRVLFLDSTPPGLYVDEAAIGYNAYSIVHTGRDEYGQFLPIFLRSYEALTSSLVLPFVGVPIFFFNLSIVPLRITPVILGSISVLLMIILVSKRFGSMKDGLRAGIILAIAPSHVLWSRSFYESSLGLMMFLISLCQKGWLSIIFLSLTAYSYQSLRLTTYMYLLYLLLVKK